MADYFGLKQHLFPFTDMKKNLYIPLTCYWIDLSNCPQCIWYPTGPEHPDYENMIHDIEEVAKTHPNLIFVAGHEHNLQLLKDTNYLLYSFLAAAQKPHV